MLVLNLEALRRVGLASEAAVRADLRCAATPTRRHLRLPHAS